MINAHTFTLANGLRVIHVPMEDNPTAEIMVLVEVGSHFEKKGQSGIAHFLEHMCFKGTTKRPKPVDIVRELDRIGAEYNAFTGREYTGYWTKAQAGHFNTIAEITSDIFLNSTFPEHEIEKEKGVVIGEINMYLDDPQSVVVDDFRALMFGQEQPAGWDIAGTKEDVQALNKEDIVSFHKKHYVPASTVVVVAGGVDASQVKEMVNAHFASMPPGEKVNKLPTKKLDSGVKVSFKTKKTDQTHLVFGFRTFDKYDNRRYVSRVMRTVLRGGMSSRLFQRFRDELGMGYYINADYTHLTDLGTFTVSTGLDEKRLVEGVKELIAQFEKLRNELVSDEELQKARDYLSGRILLGLETSDDYADFYGFQALFSTEPLRTPEEVIKRLHAVTAKDIQDMAREYFTTDNIHLAVIGPKHNEEEVKKYLRFA